MHGQIKNVVESVLETYGIEVKASIPMDRDFFCNLITVELYKELAPKPKAKPAAKKPESLLPISLGGNAI